MYQTQPIFKLSQLPSLIVVCVTGWFLFYVLFKLFCKKYCLLQNKFYICTGVKEVICTANFKTKYYENFIRKTKKS